MSKHPFPEPLELSSQRIQLLEPLFQGSNTPRPSLLGLVQLTTPPTMAGLEKQLLTLFADYTLNNPDTLTKYKTAAQISEKVLAEVSKLVVAGEKIVTICEKGDKLIEEEIAKVYRGKKITKGKRDARITTRLCHW